MAIEEALVPGQQPTPVQVTVRTWVEVLRAMLIVGVPPPNEAVNARVVAVTAWLGMAVGSAGMVQRDGGVDVVGDGLLGDLQVVQGLGLLVDLHLMGLQHRHDGVDGHEAHGIRSDEIMTSISEIPVLGPGGRGIT